MKLRFAVLFLSLSLLTACSPSAPESEIGSPDTGRPADVALALDPAPAYLACRIIDGAEDGNLLLAELDAPLDHEQGLHDGKGVYRLTVGDIPVTLDGQPAAAGDLRDGMAVEITFGGTILESFPGQLGEVSSLAAFSPAGGALTDRRTRRSAGQREIRPGLALRREARRGGAGGILWGSAGAGISDSRQLPLL